MNPRTLGSYKGTMGSLLLQDLHEFDKLPLDVPLEAGFRGLGFRSSD